MDRVLTVKDGVSETERGEENMQPDASPPVFNLPRSIVVALGLLISIYVIQEYVLGDEARATFVVNLAFVSIRYAFPLGEQNLAWLWSPVTYSLLHGGLEHIIFNSLWLMAFGAPVAKRFGALRFTLFWIFSAVAAAFFHAALNWGEPALLIGASGVVSALMGAACRFAFPGRRGYDRNHGHLYPRQSIIGAFRNRTVVTFTAMWFIGNILIAFGVTLFGTDVGPIAWDAHIGGFVFGFLLFGLFDPLPSAREMHLPQS
jgi:membrane associated rhomboid family serine protease